MRDISKSDKLSIYFQTFPHFFGEGLLLMGAIMTISFFPQWQVLIALVLLVIGCFIIKSKFNKMRVGVKILQLGDQTMAVITGIEDAGWEHNGRRVRKYNFQYTAEGRRFNHKYNSSFKRDLEIGHKLTLFYLRDDPTDAFIPQLYGVYLYK